MKKVIDTDVENVDNIVVTATMTAPDRGDGYSDITPVLDLERMSLIGVENYLDTSSTANNDVQGYISKKVTLSYPAEAVRVFVNTNRVSSDANLNVYARIKPSEITGIANDTPFEQRPWQKMSLLRTNGGSTSNLISTGTTNSPALRINDNSDTFTEHEFRFEPSGVTASANNFDEYAIKIGWTGTDAAKIVKVKDLRAIATS